MAENFTQEGLEYIMTQFPRVTAVQASNLWMTLFFTSASTATASVVPASTATASGITGWVEASPLTRVVVAASNWAAPTASGGGVRSAGAQVTFAAFATAPASAIAGFAITTASVTQTGDKVLFFSNFDDRTLITAGASDQIKVTPTWGYDV